MRLHECICTQKALPFSLSAASCYQKALPFSLSAAIRRGIPFVASTPIACPRETTDKRRATTTNSSSSHHQDSAPSRPHSLICTGAEPFHPVHASSKLGCAAVAPRNEVIFLPFWRALHDVCKTSLACSTLGSTAAMLTMVKSVKTLTKSFAVSLLDTQNRTQAGQGTWKCGLPAEFID